MGVAVIGTGKAVKADAAYIDPVKTLRQAGHLMRELGVAALVVRAENGEVHGTISRDMVVRSIAAGGDPKTVTVGEVASAGVAHRRAGPLGRRRGHAAPSQPRPERPPAELGGDRARYSVAGDGAGR